MSELTAVRLHELLHYDPETGVFTRLVRSSNSPAGSMAGGLMGTGYMTISVAGKPYLAHRLAVLYMLGRWPANEVDHRDGVRTNNRWTNLREATTAENATNRRKPRPRTRSGLIGAKLVATTGRWRADIKVGAAYKYLGTFDTPEEAHAVYVAAKRSLHPFATL